MVLLDGLLARLKGLLKQFETLSRRQLRLRQVRLDELLQVLFQPAVEIFVGLVF